MRLKKVKSNKEYAALSIQKKFNNFSFNMELNKVLISDAVDASCREILEGAGVSVDYRPGLSKDDLLTAIKVTTWAWFRTVVVILLQNVPMIET